MSADPVARQASGPLTICLDYRPELGGLTRGICDLAVAVGGDVVSLDTAAFEPSGQPAPSFGLVRHRVSPWAIHAPLGRLPIGVERLLDVAIAQAPLVILHSLYRAHLPAVVRLCRRHDIPYWVVTHGMLDPWVMSRRRFAKNVWMKVHGRQCLAGAAAVVFSTDAERDKARPVYRGRNSVVIPWPIDLPDLSGRAAARRSLRGELGLGEGGRVLLWMGRYDSLKRPVEVVEAFAAAAPHDWALVMAGFPGDVSEGRVAAAARLRAPVRIHVRGAAQGSDKETLLLGADAFISLSWRENFGYALAEAMAHGLPTVVAPDHDLLAAAGTAAPGWACVDHSRLAAAAAVRGLCTAPGLILEEAGARGRSWVADTLGRGAFQDRVSAVMHRQRSAFDAVSRQPATS